MLQARLDLITATCLSLSISCATHSGLITLTGQIARMTLDLMECVLLQLETMARTSILITPCGGTGTVLTFLPPGSTAIVFNYWQDLRNVSIQMESIYYWLVANWQHSALSISQ